jgi:hypothetical protein
MSTRPHRTSVDPAGELRVVLPAAGPVARTRPSPSTTRTVFSWSVRRHAALAVQGVPEDRDGDSLWPVGCGLQGFSEAAGQAAAHAAAFLARRSPCPDFWPQLQGTTLLDHTLWCWKMLGPRREPVASGAARSGPFTPPVGKTSLTSTRPLRFRTLPSGTRRLRALPPPQSHPEAFPKRSGRHCPCGV